MKRRRAKVAILGGGCAAMAAAFELSRPELQDRFELTVYQLGFRLGGKGASGRGACDRIEEHGLHLWMGFYENAFRLMRECYAELGRDPSRCRIATWRDAFSPSPDNGVVDFGLDGTPSTWTVLFPPGSGLPGDPDDSSGWTVGMYLARCLSLVRTLLASLETGEAPVTAAEPSLERLTRWSPYAELGGLAALREGVSLLGWALAQTPAGAADSNIPQLLASVSNGLSQRLSQLVAQRPAARRLWEVVDLLLAVVRGCIRHRLLGDPRGFDAIDEYDCREWLLANGAERSSIDSAFVRALYDLAFAYEHGDVRRPRIAAGQALRGALRAFFTYRGSFFWRMNTGMGDAVFAPYYEVLKRRGVRFEFFHKLTNVGLGKGSQHVAALDFDVQAEVRGGAEYAPLIDVRGLPCWPALPCYEQLEGGEALRGVDFEAFADTTCSRRRRLRVGRDFDLVVLGVGVGAVPLVTRELRDRDPAWRAMLQRTASVATQAVQVWLEADRAALGGRGAGNISGFVEPFDTWADMTHLAGEESWPRAPGSIAYFCSVLPDAPGDAAVRREEVFKNAVRFLDRDALWLWPAARAERGGFRWELLQHARAPDRDAHPFRSQYWRANVEPSDRYALSLPGSLRFRISPLDTGYDNLTVCGDWTACGFNEGCVEAATMSGRLAAHALAGTPALEDIVGYDHP